MCYGGVSLAIYMHGMTKELHKLVLASRAYDANPGSNPFTADDTCAAYFDALGDAAADGRALSVTVDIVAGTSAGGINGVCLAKVLARDGSQDALKSLWIKEGDFRTLLNAWPLGGWRARALLATAALLPRLRKPVAPLRGDRMSRLLYDAIGAMEPATPGSLLPAGGSLDLYVTATDLYGADVRVASGSGGVAQRETDHAQVLHFRADAVRNDLDERSTAALAFAARATSCFPGAFAPVSRQSFAREVAPRSVDVRALAARFRNRYGERPDGSYGSDDAWLVDGGVLDNAPFDLVVRAIGEKRAESRVVRRLAYIEPDPGRPLDMAAAVPGERGAPGYVAALRQGALTVRGTHSILRELLAIRDLNVRIGAIGAITSAQMATVTAAVDAAWPARTKRRRPWAVADVREVETLADNLYARAAEFVGAGYEAYQRLKVEAAAVRLAEAVTESFEYPPESARTSFVRAVLAAWTRNRVGNEPLDRARVDELLGPVDVPYRERRLMFLLAGINELYDAPDGPPDVDLDALKGAAWTLLTDVRRAALLAVEGAPRNLLAFLRLQEDDAFDDPDAFAEANDDALTELYRAYRADLDRRLGPGKLLMWQSFDVGTREWDETHRRALLSRFVGFPLWDGLIFPTIALSRLPQFTPISVAQFSPHTARALTPLNGAKLKGVALHHFGAFAEEAWRENDYVWGRLDAAELILRTIREATAGAAAAIPDRPDAAVEAAGPRLAPALHAVFASENDIVRKHDDFVRLRDSLVAPPFA